MSLLSFAPAPAASQTARRYVLQATVSSAWQAASGTDIADEMLRWPPDVFAFTHLALDRTEAYRFVVSPPSGRQWPPVQNPDWADATARAAREWAQWAEAPQGPLPELVVQEWQIVRAAADISIDEVTSGRAWRLCQALLTLHAISDQACAGVGADIAPGSAAGISYRARTRELLARTGSMARIHPGFLRVLPKYRTPAGGISSRSVSRYASVIGPAVEVNIHQTSQRSITKERKELNMLLLPWPLQVADKDFRPVPGSVHERSIEPYGYFEFSPSEPFDISLADRVLAAAMEHTDHVDIVVLPESSVPEDQLASLETVLARHGVSLLIAGLRGSKDADIPQSSNWVHFGARLDGRWWHYRQDKHHRWSLDPSQIEQYHLGAVLDPRVRWWEALELRPRSLQLIERGDGYTIASLVCEDLAHIDEVIDAIRLVGPTLLVALLLDGPQLSSRWAARYASVLVDDPGSPVLTVTSYGMVRTGTPAEHPPSSVVALWKDSGRGTHEIALDADAHAILLTADEASAIRRAADGRTPECTTADLRLARITQIRATAPHPKPGPASSQTAEPPPFSSSDLTILLSWSDAITEARLASPSQLDNVLADTTPEAQWRADLDLPKPSGALAEALVALVRAEGAAA